MRRIVNLACMVAVLLSTQLMGSRAGADMVTYNVSFSASDFFPSPPPTLTTLSGSFTVTFDPSLTYRDATAPIQSFHMTGTSYGVVGMTYDEFLTGAPDFLVVGGLVNTVTVVTPGTDDFGVGILNFTTAPEFYRALVTTASDSTNYWNSSTGWVTVQVVPLPPAALLFGSGLLGLVGWRGFRKG